MKLKVLAIAVLLFALDRVVARFFGLSQTNLEVQSLEPDFYH